VDVHGLLSILQRHSMDFHRSSSVCSVSLIFIFCLLIVVVEKHYSAVVQCSNFGTRVRSKIHQGSRAPKEKASPANRPRLVSLCFASIVFFHFWYKRSFFVPSHLLTLHMIPVLPNAIAHSILARSVELV